MTRLLYDSTNIYDIPTSAPMVGYYVDGIYAVSAATVRARFPSATLVGISAVGTDNGIVGDVEPGCMTPQQAVQWVRFRRAANADPTIYCNETYGWPNVRAAFRAAGVTEPHYWCANYDNVRALRPGEVARQFANPTLTHGHYDLSVVADYWPGVDGHSGGLTMEADVHAAFVALQNELTVPASSPILQALAAQTKAQADNAAAIVAAIKANPPRDSVDVSALAAALAPLLPTQSKPPAPPQAVKDWWASLMKYFGWA